MNFTPLDPQKRTDKSLVSSRKEETDFTELDEGIKNIGVTQEEKDRMIQALDIELQQIEQKLKGSEAEEAIYNTLRSYIGEDRVISSKEIPQILNDLPSRMKTGQYDFDSLSGGFGEENLVVISGPTGQGKTLLAQNITSWLAQEGHRSLWFSYELSLAELLQRFNSFENKPEFYIPKNNTSNSMMWIERKIVESMAKYQTKFVFIDHTYYLLDKGHKKDNLAFEIGVIVRELKLIARKYGIVIFLMHHTNKVEALEAPTITDLRDSALVGNEADYVIMVWRKPFTTKPKQMLMEGIQYTNDMLVCFVKNRFSGKLGTITLTCQNNNLKSAYATSIE